jgi:P27 family predicted phage terminase small subunit
MTVLSRASFAVKPPAPTHLSAESKRFWRQITGMYVLEAHHLELLRLACEALDRGIQARQTLERDGLTVADRFGVARPHPCVAIERDARLSVARLVKALDLDYEGPQSIGRPPSAS